ncbi:PEP-CTERM protein-sorting domain-containing protein [Duganella sp. CF402]|uniref:PEP-CTERM sorting domain-containing protein n=1 Tax=unclassified Duganella TaxID=2636909 RepID=UPI0008BB7EE5|nr:MULTISPECIES: PEP-CTERM sorting domain-containing protein [unclassified Duganella]RZT06136.1 putative secreted protein with PEP-CTERM sorting signal [Duganella sp. BK701]SEM74740.1 PEP-CTERM protein-sorting domain-containing protein [Duganella sp. CF402]
MKKLALVVALLGLAGGALADTNVALNGAVTLSATAGFGDSAGWGGADLAAASTVTDGVFLPINTQWNTGTVFWSGDYGVDTITVTLNHKSSVSSLALQGDNDNNYLIEYLDSANTWQTAAVISPNRSWGQDNGYATLGSPVVTTAFRISGAPGAGDFQFSVSEFQANGSVVPEPATYAMLVAGLGLLGVAARRQSHKGNAGC